MKYIINDISLDKNIMSEVEEIYVCNTTHAGGINVSSEGEQVVLYFNNKKEVKNIIELLTKLIDTFED